MRTHVALWLLLSSLRLALQSDAAASQRLSRQQAALEPSPATWTKASERCATLGPGLAPLELAEQAAADGLLFGRVTTHECTPHGSDATVVWVDVRDGRDVWVDAASQGGSSGRPAGEQCPALSFNHTNRQARATAEACDRHHCFLCSDQQARLRKSAAGSAQSGRRLMVADSTNCNMTGKIPHTSRCNSCRLCPTELFSSPNFRAGAAPDWRHCFEMGRLGGQQRLPLRRVGRGDVRQLWGSHQSVSPIQTSSRQSS
jgi:hypothetical protein